QRCLARNEGDRFKDGAEVAAGLRGWLAPPRRLSRIPVVVALVLAIGGAVAAVAISGFPGRKDAMDPRGQVPNSREQVPNPQEQILDDDANGRTVTLIADGQPRFFGWRLGELVTNTRQWHSDAAFSLDTQRKALVELVPPGGRPERFRVRGKVRMNDDIVPKFSHGGIYIAAGPIETPRGIFQAVIELGFCDWFSRRPAGAPQAEWFGEASVQCRLLGTTPDQPVAMDRDHKPRYRAFPTPQTAPRQDRKYHDLALDVGPTEVIASFDGKPFPPLNYRH